MSERNFSLFYTTVSDHKTAERISEILVTEKLAACTNILPKMTSFYLWKDKLEKSEEAVVLIKSLSSNKAKLEARLLTLHTYETPCLLEIGLNSVNSKYAEWMMGQII